MVVKTDNVVPARACIFHGDGSQWSIQEKAHRAKHENIRHGPDDKKPVQTKKAPEKIPGLL
ncbi:hypothetical protein [Desulfocicer vacuolatum]|uniref:hypothetical protein n=1 Tax=Desulfocicer vacuolatum TaxID=2298 RepID=UPI000A05566D|nr:hypothetical protein [Desulfocicer vacuolatum]